MTLENSLTNSLSSTTCAQDFSKFAKQKALELGVPTKKNENWKYTNLQKYMPEYDLSSQSAFSPEVGKLDPNYSHLFFVNGEINQELSEIEPLTLKNGEKALESIKKLMGDLLADDFAFQLSELQDKNQYMLVVDKVWEKPLWIHHIYGSENAKHSSSHMHIFAKRSSQLDIYESHSSFDSSETFSNNSSSFYLEANSNVSYTKAQSLNTQSSNVQNVRAHVSRDANFESITLDVGARLSRNNIAIVLAEEAASASAHGLYAIAGEQQSDTNSHIRHAKGHTESAQLYKGIMADKAHGIFSGIIRMDRQAQLCNSEQLNKNLLLSKGAHAHSRPQLEIFADDVKAAHGSTTGQLSDDELFYFQARGVSKEKAQKLLAQAFLNDVLLKIKNTLVRKTAQEMVAENFKALQTE